MPLPKSKKNAGLGKAIIRDRFKGARPRDGDTQLHTAELDDGPSWTKLQSVTQERDLDAFLNTAQLAGTEFTAERLNIKVVTNSYSNPFLLTPEKEQETLKKHEDFKERLTVPRRPYWDKTTTAEQLQRAERESFLEWRRGLAELQESHELLLTPFERNIEVWRQLWRVIERSELIVQIVDARNPLFFRSTDLETYVKEVDPRKRNLLLVNKSDMLSERQRRLWADYFDRQGIRYTFFSAALSAEKLERERLREEMQALKETSPTTKDEDGEEEEEEEDKEVEEEEEEKVEEAQSAKDDTVERSTERLNNVSLSEAEENEHESSEVNPEREHERYEDEDEDEEEEAYYAGGDERTRIITTAELIDLLVGEAPKISEEDLKKGRKLNIGLVGYPNVGKSSTINALLGEKRVSVSSTPGKTKHFQTIHLSPTLVLCDCPGLVFPTFATTNGDMVCNGVLPIDQLREHTGPAALVARRIPKNILEAVYGIQIKTKAAEEGGDGIPTAEELLAPYAVVRGFMRAVQGNPDEARAARYILKDYVNGKLLYCHPPPGVDADDFNQENRDIKRYKINKAAAAQLARQSGDNGAHPTGLQGAGAGTKSHAVDSAFFAGPGGAPRIKGKFSRMGPFSRVLLPHHGQVSEDGSIRGSRGAASAMPGAVASGKKSHKKGKKHVKVRHRDGYD
ncbi:uncharacterized protein VTP21DRAFT_5229 [Calcarisporiella thermophila]|uniref:uncharacterized protein n=1 Tax=Calcarisporiella thermophila TaxID=911321 RepID=UPI0037437938